ncbi:MAG: MotA/TolQ/ExbB proton channel family protein [Bdellovibrionales bacterium]|nr:MotA/TolQ/ExbB proton channel family protein [Bdellovibrionales bacterium]
MLSNVFMGLSLLGAEWVLYLLVILSMVSVGLIIERVLFYRSVTQEIADFRKKVRAAVGSQDWTAALKAAEARIKNQELIGAHDLETGLVTALLDAQKSGKTAGVEVLNEIAQDQVVRAKISWEKNLSVLATIGSNSPFVGLFGTVLGIIKAFHDLSKQQAQGVQTVTAGISEALVATAVGILVAIPAVVAFNFFQRRVKAALGEAEAMKSFIVGQMARSLK